MYKQTSIDNTNLAYVFVSFGQFQLLNYIVYCVDLFIKLILTYTGIAVYDPNAIHSDTEYSYVEPRLYSNVLSLFHGQAGHRTSDQTVLNIHVDNPSYTTDSEYQEIGIPRDEPPTSGNKSKVNITSPNPATPIKPPQKFKQELQDAVKKGSQSTNGQQLLEDSAVQTKYTFPRPTIQQKPKYRNPPPLPLMDGRKDFQLPVRQPLPKPTVEASTTAKKENMYSNDVPRSAISPTPIVTKPLRPPSSSRESEHITSIRKVQHSDDVCKLSIEEVGEYLKKIKLDAYVQTFKDQMVDGNMLLELDRDILKEEFGMKGIEALRLIKFATEGHIPS